MTRFKREISTHFAAWKDAPRRKPLIVRGARQVGKSTVVADFGATAFRSCAVVNFDRRPDMRSVFLPDRDPRRILGELEVKLHQPIRSGETLLFFDEIQECPEAIECLRYFYEELPAQHVIAAGSLLEFALQEIGAPVGRVEYAWMYPLSFSEFLAATGRGSLAARIPVFDARDPSLQRYTLAPALTDEAYRALREYMIVGGMPEAVLTFVDTGSYLKVDDVLDQIAVSFFDDIRKYARGDKQIHNVGQVLRRMFRFVGQEITYSTLGDGDAGPRTAKSVQLLEQAMLCHRVKAASPSSLPMAASGSDKHFKVILLDIGLGRRMANLDASDLAHGSDFLSAYEGRAAEQFVGQNLLAETGQGSEGRALFCWIRAQKSAKAEVDYLIARQGRIIPVEVKKGATGRLRSLIQCMKDHPSIKLAVCLRHVERAEQSDGILFLPLYTRI